ncbi:MAG: tryptophan synthase subunit alpha [Pseudomonadota bacterium]
MSRIEQRFAELKTAGRTALIPFITAGDPQPDITVPTMHAMVEGGADLIELGVPFSDPMADGPTIQYASERALLHNVSLHDVLTMVRQFREKDSETPVILMGYLNPVEIMGYKAFADEAAQAGVDGLLTVDMPPEEADELTTALRARQLDPIFLLAPTTEKPRVERICQLASGFVYYVSLKGITGAGHLDTDEVTARLDVIRAATDLPVGVGFGIKDGETAARVADVADAVIVGSAVVNRMAELQDEAEKIPLTLSNFMGELRSAMDKRS